MSLPADVIPITVYLDRKQVEKIDAWAEKIGTSRSKMVRAMVEDSASQMGWVYDFCSSPLGLRLRDLVQLITDAEARREAAGVVPAA